MPWLMRWVHSEGIWKLRARARDRRVMARIFQSRQGYTVIVPGNELAGPYGDLDIARQSAEIRALRRYGSGNGSGN